MSAETMKLYRTARSRTKMKLKSMWNIDTLAHDSRFSSRKRTVSEWRDGSANGRIRRP